MKVATVVFNPGGLSGHDEMMLNATINSVALAGLNPIQAIPEAALKECLEFNPEYCHFLWPGSLVLPGFYQAMLTSCEYESADYVYCHCAMVRSERHVILSPSPDKMAMCQIMVKAWVLLELGSNDHPSELLKRVLTDYRGAEVPHVMAMEIFP
jgi:hypothetical protein